MGKGYKPKDEGRVARVCALFDQGYSKREISEMEGLTYHSICRITAENGRGGKCKASIHTPAELCDITVEVHLRTGAIIARCDSDELQLDLITKGGPSVAATLRKLAKIIGG